MSKPPKYTLITGASHGIGKALAEECARKKLNLVLVALPDSGLEALAEQLTNTYSVKVHYFGLDLREKEAPQCVWEWCQEQNLAVNMLINNAGVGAGGRFENIPFDTYVSIMRLNNQAMVGLTYYFLPELKAQPSAHILNVSSIEATLPLPYKAVYTGTKNFVYAFSLALREELKTGSVKVSVLCPGPVLTNPEGLNRIQSHGGKAKLIVLMPEEVAKIAIRKLLKGRVVIVPGRVSWGVAKVMRFLPTLTKMSILERLFRVYEDH